MKKVLLLALTLLFLSGCSLIGNNQTSNTGNTQKISELEQQLSGLIEQFSGLQAENKQLKNTINDNLTEKWNDTPAEIKKIYTINQKTYLSIDILTRNPNFMPGSMGIEGDYYINQNVELREVLLSIDLKYYKCGAQMDNPKFGKEYNLSEFINSVRVNTIYSFDIENSIVSVITEECLP